MDCIPFEKNKFAVLQWLLENSKQRVASIGKICMQSIWARGGLALIQTGKKNPRSTNSLASSNLIRLVKLILHSHKNSSNVFQFTQCNKEPCLDRVCIRRWQFLFQWTFQKRKNHLFNTRITTDGYISAPIKSQRIYCDYEVFVLWNHLLKYTRWDLLLSFHRTQRVAGICRLVSEVND